MRCKVNENKISTRYEILEELGRGGMGAVYKVFDQHLKRTVAMKVIFEQYSERFSMELETMARLQHPNIIQLFDYGLSPQPFFTMEYLEGTTLGEYCQKQKVDEAQLIDFFIQICEAICEAHSQKILHRDLKPSNIMICNGQIKVMDFGLAKEIGGQKLSRTGDIVGTPVYMAPEQLEGKASQKSDIYSIGATLYEVLTNRQLYQGASEINIIIQIHEQNPIIPRDLNPDICAYLEAICLKCLAKNPEKRYRSIQALLREFKNLKNNRPITAKKYTQIDRIKNLAVLHRKIFTVVAIIVVLLVFFNFRLMLKEKQLRAKDISLRKTLETLQNTVQEVDTSNKRLRKLNEAMIEFTRNIQQSRYNDLLLQRDLIKPLELVFAQSIYFQTAKEYEFLRGFILWQGGNNLEQALKDFSQAIAKDPNNYLALMNRGNLYKDLKSYKKALADYNRALQVNPYGYRAYNNRALIYQAWRQYQKALADFSKAISLNKSFVMAYNNRGLLYRDLQKYDLALADYNRAIALEPKYDHAYTNRGYLHYLQKKYTLALQDYKKALSLSSKDPYIFANRGLVYQALGKDELAMQDYNKAIELDSSERFPSPAAYNARGTLFKKQQNYELALRDFAKALEIDINYIHTYINRASIYLHLEQYQKALDDYHMAFKLDDNDVDAVYGKGLVYFKTQKYAEAIEYWEMAVALGHPRSQLIRSTINQMRGK